VVTAERLFALHGIDGVSLRQISVEAGNANNSAVQYHFGSREDLVQAIFEYRVPRLTRRRQLLRGEASSKGLAQDLRSCVETYLLPVVEEGEVDDSYYLSFLTKLGGFGLGEHPFDRAPESLTSPTHEFIRRASALLAEVPRKMRPHRVAQAMTICVHAAADRQQARRHGATTLPYAVYVGDLFDGLVGLLRAPASDAVKRLIATVPPVSNSRYAVP
jgi:AcrR family transcriptional regulator